MKQLLITIFVCTLLSSCGWKPVPLWLGGPDPRASDAYKLGWEDGCESGMAAYGNLMYKTLHSYRFDKEMARNPEYARAWRDSYGYCRHYTGTWVK